MVAQTRERPRVGRLRRTRALRLRHDPLRLRGDLTTALQRYRQSMDAVAPKAYAAPSGEGTLLCAQCISNARALRARPLPPAAAVQLTELDCHRDLVAALAPVGDALREGTTRYWAELDRAAVTLRSAAEPGPVEEWRHLTWWLFWAPLLLAALYWLVVIVPAVPSAP